MNCLISCTVHILATCNSFIHKIRFWCPYFSVFGRSDPDGRSILNWIPTMAQSRPGQTFVCILIWRSVGRRWMLFNNSQPAVFWHSGNRKHFKLNIKCNNSMDKRLCFPKNTLLTRVMLLETHFKLENRSCRSHRNAVENATKAKTQFSGWVTTTAGTAPWPRMKRGQDAYRTWTESS